MSFKFISMNFKCFEMNRIILQSSGLVIFFPTFLKFSLLIISGHDQGHFQDLKESVLPQKMTP